MDRGAEAGVFLTLNDCTVLFPRFKANEFFLSAEERRILHRIEKVLYGNLSIREMEELLDKGAASSKSGFPGSFDA
jgi:hypothetical protein